MQNVSHKMKKDTVQLTQCVFLGGVQKLKKKRIYTIKIQVTSKLLKECYAKVPMSTTRGFPWSLVELSLDLEQGQDRVVRKVGCVPGSPDGSPAPC